MSFKGEVAAAILASKHTDLTVGDIYRIVEEGKLGNTIMTFGTFVEWTGTTWKVKKDMQYATSKTGESLDNTAISLEEIFFANSDVPASTLRFSFGDPNYDPTTDTAVASRHNTADRAGGGTPAGYGGTWKKLLTKFANIWDYTYTDNTLLNEFDNGNRSLADADTETRFWNDAEHNPIKIIASNTAGCESFKRAFQGCWAITEIWNLDTSDATNMFVAFSYCKNLVKIPQMDMSSNTDFRAIFQDCLELESMPAPIFPDDDSLNYSAQALWLNCQKLKAVNGVLNLKSITNISEICIGCRSIKSITMQNTSRIKRFGYAFCGCPDLSLEFFDSLDTANATNLNDICRGEVKYPQGDGPYLIRYDVVMKNITRMPNFDMSSATNVSNAFHLCNLESIDTTILSTLSGSVNVSKMFIDNRNCKSGILDAYTVLDAVDNNNHADCFLNCGIDTEEGRAELEQIPASWGGLAP